MITSGDVVVFLFVGGPHIQVANIGTLSIKVDYQPGSVSGGGLRRGDIAELLKLVPIQVL